jgi:hypothetical protein
MSGYTSPSRGTVRTLPKFLCCSQNFLLFYVLFLCKCVLYNCHRLATQLQLTNISYIIPHVNMCLETTWYLKVKNALVKICVNTLSTNKFYTLHSETQKIGNEERTFMPGVRYRCEILYQERPRSFVSIFLKSPRSLPLFLSIIYSRFAPFFRAIRTRWQLD